jgi:hypothetical protein
VVIGDPEDGLDGPLFFLGGHLFLSEALLHFGPEHPLLELRFHPLLGRLLGQRETLAFQGHPLLGLFAFAQGDQAGGELSQILQGQPLLAGGFGQPLGGDGEVQRKPLGERAGDGFVLVLPAGSDLAAHPGGVLAE